MIRWNISDETGEALFASGLQRSDVLTPETLAEAVGRALRQFGPAGCAARMAQEFGDHPEVAASRMRWIRQVLGQMSAAPASRLRVSPAPVLGPTVGGVHRAA
jgi:hypothetical protein